MSFKQFTNIAQSNQNCLHIGLFLLVVYLNCTLKFYNHKAKFQVRWFSVYHSSPLIVHLAFFMKNVIPETRRVHQIRYLRFYFI
jgi:hypothetical protein